MLYYYPLQLNRLYTTTEYSHNKHLSYLENFKCSQSKSAEKGFLILRVTDLN